MTTKLEKAIEIVRKLPAERQDEVADVIEMVAAQESTRPFTAEENRAIDEGLADANAGRFATDEEVEELFLRLRSV